MPDWVVPTLLVAIMLIMILRHASRIRATGTLPPRILSRWILGTIAGTVLVVPLFWGLWKTSPPILGSQERLGAAILVLGFGIILVSGLYVWQRLGEKTLLIRGARLAGCACGPPLVYYSLRGRIAPVWNAVLLLFLLILSLALLGFYSARRR